MFHRLVKPSLAVGVAAIAGYHGLQIYTSIALPFGLNIATTDRISHDFKQSLAVSTVNPHHRATSNDSRSIIVMVPQTLSHEQILARFLKGFFGGYVFAPEGMALRLWGKSLVDFKELDGTPASRHVWRASELNQTSLPALHSVLFGVFRIVDTSQFTSLDQLTPKRSLSHSSYVDIAFGAEGGLIAGANRFSVLEAEDSVGSEGTRAVTIIYDCTSYNPREKKPLGWDLLQTFHLWYAMLLFKEGVVGVLKAH